MRTSLPALLGALFAATWLLPLSGQATPLRVVTTLSTFKALVEAVGGDRVEVQAIAAPQFNPHFIEPRPSDVLRVKRADLFVHGGLDLEAWRGPLVDAAGNPHVRPGGDGELDLSQGIHLLNIPGGTLTRAEGDIHLFGNPHYWTSPENALVMSESIARKLSSFDPDGANYYQSRRESFAQRLQEHMLTWSDRAKLMHGKKVVLYHDEWVYLLRYLNVATAGFIEPKPGIPPSPRYIEQLAQLIKGEGVQVIAQSSFSPDAAARELAEQTGAKVVKLCQNVGELPDCSDYISTVEFNVSALVER